MKFQNLVGAAVRYLGDAGHRRAASVVIAMVASTALGHAVGADQVGYALDLVIGAVGGAWTSKSANV